MATMNPNSPPFFKWGPQLSPALSRAVASFDVGRGLGKILDLIFDLMDADSNQTVDRHEVKLFFDDIGSIIDEGPERGMPLVMELFFRIVDKNKDGKLSLEEAQGLAAYIVEMVACLFASVVDIVETVLTSSEVMGVAEQVICQRGQLSPLDTNADGLLSRDEFTAGINQAMPQFTMMLEMGKAQAGDTFAQIKAMRENLAQAESSFTMGVLMRGMEWMSGGVDEATFLARVVPAYREQIMSMTPDKMMQNFQAAQSMNPAGGGAVGAEDGTVIYGNPLENIAYVPEGQAVMRNAFIAYRDKWVEFAPEVCRQIFKLIDIDNSGTITRREVTVLKAVMDGFLRLGSLCSEEGMTAEDKAEMSRIYPDLFNEGNEALPEQQRLQVEARALSMAIFDTLDKNGDGTLSPDEIAGFMVKLSSFFLQLSKCYVLSMFELFKEIGKESLKQMWEKANMTEISKEEFPAMMQMLPMMLMAPMMTPDDGPTPMMCQDS